jgi:hypothetical protein
LATVIIEDVAVVTVIVLFAWLVPARQNGIPGLGGRGRVPAHRAPGGRAPGRRAAGRRGPGRHPAGRAVRADPAVAAVAETQPQPVRPRPVPAAERISPADAARGPHGRDRAQDERDRAQDERVLAELDKTWAPDYADRVAAQLRERKGR